MGTERFSNDSALLYHEHLPTAIVSAEEHAGPQYTRAPNLPLKPRHLKTHKLDASGADPITGRQPLLANDDVRLSYSVAEAPSPLYRNAIGDECVYVESGSARFESVFGAFDLGRGDYLLVPTSTTYRLVPTTTSRPEERNEHEAEQTDTATRQRESIAGPPDLRTETPTARRPEER